MSAFQNQTVVVSGASKGIGRALALILAERSANLVLCARGGDALREAVVLCKEKGVRAVGVEGDVSRCKTANVIRSVAMKLAGAGRKSSLWGFIHAAGVLHPGPSLWELNTRQFETIMGASVGGAFQLCRVFAPKFSKMKRGVAVFFGSGAADISQPGIGAYCAAKAAEEHLMRQLAAECPKCVSLAYRPGIVETGMQVEARKAKGGQARKLRSVFRPWKDKRLLWTPEQSAGILADFLETAGPGHSGKVVDGRELLDRQEGAAGQDNGSTFREVVLPLSQLL